MAGQESRGKYTGAATYACPHCRRDVRATGDASRAHDRVHRAGPDLLAALEHAIEHGSRYDDAGALLIPSGNVTLMRAAIAKALGQ